MEYLTAIPSRIAAATTSYFYEPAHAKRERQNAENSRLLRLPAELRNEIYRLYLAAENENIFIPLDLSWGISQGPHAGLTRTCRSLRREVLPMFLHAGKLFSATILHEDREWDTKAHAVIAVLFKDALVPCVPLKRVHFRINIDCAAYDSCAYICPACATLECKKKACINVDIRSGGLPTTATVTANHDFQDVDEFYMRRLHEVLVRLQGLIGRMNCVNLCKKKSQGVEKRDMIDVMELMREVVREDRDWKWMRTRSCDIVFEM